jgi:hypothetical protein
MRGMGRERKPYTEFGRTLRRLMWDRDVRSWSSLGEMLKAEVGVEFSHQSMSKYAAGTVSIPPEFVAGVAQVLRLSESERAELAVAYAYASRADNGANSATA